MSHQESSGATPQERKGSHGHGWLMLACCIPMLVIAVALLATGVVGIGFVFIALLCTATMALMMRGMSHGDGGEGDRRDAGHHQ